MKSMLVNHHKIIIAVPVYNEEKFIKKALLSLKEQTYKDFRVFIADNNSTDNTEKTCKELIQNDDRFYYFKHTKNHGGGYNFKFLFDNSSSEYIQFFGSHDFLEKTYLEKAITALDQDKEASLYFTAMQEIDENDSLRKVIDNTENILPSNLSPQERVVWLASKTTCYPILNVFRRNSLSRFPNYNIVGPDFVMLCRLIFEGHFIYNPEILYYLRTFRNRHPDEYMERLTAEKKPMNYNTLVSEIIIDIESYRGMSQVMKQELQEKIIYILLSRYNVFNLKDTIYQDWETKHLATYLNQIPYNENVSMYGRSEFSEKLEKVLNVFRPDITIKNYLDSKNQNLNIIPPTIKIDNFNFSTKYIIIASTYFNEIKDKIYTLCNKNSIIIINIPKHTIFNKELA